jgi:hypothetical protein
MAASLVFVACVAVWHESEQQRWHERQQWRSAFMGGPAWRVEKKLPAWREALRELSPWSPQLLGKLDAQGVPALLVGIENISFTVPGAAETSGAALAIANRRAGLTKGRGDLFPPCVLLGGDRLRLPGQWLRLGSHAMCRLVAAPAGWQGLDGEFNEPVLAIGEGTAAWLQTGMETRFGAEPLMTTLYLPAPDEPTARKLLQGLGEVDLRLERTAAAHNDAVRTQEQLVGAQRWLEPAARLLSGICLLLYAWSLWRALSVELALRQAVGMPNLECLVWLFVDLCTQFAAIAITAALPALMVGLVLGVSSERGSKVMSPLVAGALMTAAMATLMSGLIWLARGNGLRRLGKP